MNSRVHDYVAKLAREQIISIWKECQDITFQSIIVKKAVLDYIEQLNIDAYCFWIKLKYDERTMEKFFEIVDEFESKGKIDNKFRIKINTEFNGIRFEIKLESGKFGGWTFGIDSTDDIKYNGSNAEKILPVAIIEILNNICHYQQIEIIDKVKFVQNIIDEMGSHVCSQGNIQWTKSHHPVVNENIIHDSIGVNYIIVFVEFCKFLQQYDKVEERYYEANDFIKKLIELQK